MTEMLERATKTICSLMSGGYCECIGESLGCKAGRGEMPSASICKMTDEAMPLTNEYQIARAVIASMETTQ